MPVADCPGARWRGTAARRLVAGIASMRPGTLSAHLAALRSESAMQATVSPDTYRFGTTPMTALAGASRIAS